MGAQIVTFSQDFFIAETQFAIKKVKSSSNMNGSGMEAMVLFKNSYRQHERRNIIMQVNFI